MFLIQIIKCLYECNEIVFCYFVYICGTPLLVLWTDWTSHLHGWHNGRDTRVQSLVNAVALLDTHRRHTASAHTGEQSLLSAGPRHDGSPVRFTTWDFLPRQKVKMLHFSVVFNSLWAYANCVSNILIIPQTRITTITRELYEQVLIESAPDATPMTQPVTRAATEWALDFVSTPNHHELVEENYTVWRLNL